MSFISNRGGASALFFVWNFALNALLAFMAITQLTGHGSDLLWQLTGFYFWSGPVVWGGIAALTPFCAHGISRLMIIAVDILLLVTMVETSQGRLDDIGIYVQEMPLTTVIILLGIGLTQVTIIYGLSLAASEEK